MSDNRFSFGDEQLFAEFTLEGSNLIEDINNEAAEAISGGQFNLVAQQAKLIEVTNETNLPIYLDMDFGGNRSQDFRLESGKSKIFINEKATEATIDFDNSFCDPGIQLTSYTLVASKKYGFRLNGNCKVELYDLGAIT